MPSISSAGGGTSSPARMPLGSVVPGSASTTVQLGPSTGSAVPGATTRATGTPAAAAAGVPVARVVAQGTADPVLGPSWTVVEALPGTTDPSGILAGEDVPPPAELIDGIAAALAAVHRIPADPGLAPAVEDPLTLLRAMHDSLGEPHPTFELAFAALQRTRPAASERALVHGDFRMGNLM